MQKDCTRGAFSYHISSLKYFMSDYLTWCKIRDHLLGENKSKQDLAKAFSISASCSHEDATWFHKVLFFVL